MSIKLMTAVWDRPDLTSTQKLVLLALADWANDEGLCWPSIDRVAVKASLKRRAVQMTIRSLEESGFLLREEMIGKGNKYWVNIPVQNMHPCITDTPPAHEMHPTRASNAPNTSITHQLTTKSNILAQPECVSKEVWDDFLAIRKAKRAPLTNTALDAIQREAAKAGWTLNEALSESVARGWQAFKADWVKETNNGKNNRATSTGQRGSSADGFTSVLREVGSRENAFPTFADDERMQQAPRISFDATGRN